MNKGNLYVISAPSGAGKTSLVNALKNTVNKLVISTSYTTRKPRINEKDGEDYHFISTHKFNEMMAEKDFLEHAEVFGNFYGTSKKLVDKKRNEGYDVILEIDWQGAQQVAKHACDAIKIFILPPSIEELKRRLNKRGTDSEDTVSFRMARATNEIIHYQEFDYLVVNDEFNKSLENLKAIITAHHLITSKQHICCKDLIQELLSSKTC